MRRAWLLGLGLLGAASAVVIAVLLLTGGEQLERAGAASGCESGTAVPEPANNPGLVADCETLLALRDELRGTATLDWSAETSIRRWSGVLISGAPPRVTRIWLWSSSLSGRVSAGLGKLTALTSLDLHDNALSGAIPAELGSLTQLQTLHLNKNKLTGNIPAELEQLSQLQWVTLAGNTLEGCVPPKLRKVRFNDLPQLRLRDCASTPPTATATPTPTATVAPQTHTLTLTAGSGGSLSANPAGPSYAKGTTVTVTATAEDGYKLSSWGDACSDTLATSTACSLTMDADKTVSATFAQNVTPTTFRYSTYDTTGQAATAGSYAFLTANSTSSQGESAQQGTQGSEVLRTPAPVTTYEGLREDANTLRIHVTDGSGVSRASFYGTVEVGDTFEWRESETCWVRYGVTAVKAGNSPREFAITPYSYAFTGCSGALSGDGSAQADQVQLGAKVRAFNWELELLKTGAITVPVMHGPFLLVPKTWTGSLPARAAFTPPEITWPPSPLPSPDLGAGWTGGVVEGYAGGLEGWYSHTDGGTLVVRIFQLYVWPYDTYRYSNYAGSVVIEEFRFIDGRPAIVSYDRVKGLTSQAVVTIYDEASGVIYSVDGGPLASQNDPETTIELARKFMEGR